MKCVETCDCCGQSLVDAYGLSHQKASPRPERENGYIQAQKSIETERRIKTAVKWLEQRR